MIGQLLTGRYLVLKILGMGGFSETYLARDKFLPHHPLCVVKCLKVSPISTISSKTAQQLFETEARVLAQLGGHHSQIPRLFAHCHEPDQIYQVQEYVDGDSLLDWTTREKSLPPAAIIGLLFEVLPILKYVHSHNVVHRDIKPANLIQRQRDGKVVLIDFGASCVLTDARTEQTVEASDESPIVIGTPGYMPDEQLEGIVQFNSDLYALGMTAIHLLTGVHPKKFDEDLISGELDWQVYLHEPVEPLLLAVLSRMVQRNPRDRHQQAADVLTAIRPLKPGRLKRWKQSKRSPLQRLWKPIVAAGLLASVAGGYYLGERNGVWSSMITSVSALFHQVHLQLTLLRDLPMQSEVNQMLVAPNNQILVTAGSDHVLRLWDLQAGTMLKSLSGHEDRISALAISQDSRLLVSGGADRIVRLWDVASGKLLREFKGHQEDITTVAISSDARMMASGSNDGTIRIWDLQAGTLRQTMTLPDGAVTVVAYGTEPDSLVSASSDRHLQVWNLRTGQLQRTFVGHTAPIIGLRTAPDHTLFSVGEDRVLVWDLKREELVQEVSEDSTKLITATLDDQHMMTVHDNGSVRVWTRDKGWLVTSSSSEWRNLSAVLSPNHRYLVCWSPDQRLRVWQIDATTIQ